VYAKANEVPHLSPILRKVGTTKARSAGFDVGVDVARVERAPSPTAFAVDRSALPLAGSKACCDVEERRFSSLP
jgi:hypothetical protein